MATISASPARTTAPPRAVAAAGVVFAVLMALALSIVRLSVSEDAAHPAVWLNDARSRSAVRLALQLVPFAGIAFLWFIGVFRARVGELEDRFFATVCLGSGLLFVASLFAAAAMAGIVVEAAGAANGASSTETSHLARWMAYVFMNIFAIKMAGMFMFSTSTISLRTGILPRWVAFTGFACGLVLLLAITHWLWITLLFPLWVLFISLQILIRRTDPRT